MSRPREISSLFVLKAICAFLVIVNHVPSVLGDIPLYTLRHIAVPIFFTITGYFLYQMDTNKFQEKTRLTIKKTLRLLLLINLIHAIHIFYIKGAIHITWNEFVQWVVFGGLFGPQLWYLTSLSWGLIIIYATTFSPILRRKVKYLLPLLFFLGLLHARYAFLLGGEGSDSLIYHAIFTSVPWLSTGLLFREKEPSLMKFKHWSILFLLAFPWSFAEDYFLSEYPSWQTRGASLSTFVLTISLFGWALQRKDFGSNSYLRNIGIYHSANIYYFHMFAAIIVTKILRLFDLEYIYHYDATVIIYFMSIVISIGIIQANKLLQKVKYSFLSKQ